MKIFNIEYTGNQSKNIRSFLGGLAFIATFGVAYATTKRYRAVQLAKPEKIAITKNIHV